MYYRRPATGRILVSVAALAALLVAGCGRDGDASGDGPAEEVAGPVEGELTVWAMGTEGEYLHVLADDFMAEFPEATVSVTPVPWDAAHDRIVNAIAGGQGPDVSLIGTTWMGEFGAMGGLDPIPANIDPAQYFEGAWETTVVDGVSYGVPWYVSAHALYYRTDLAAEGGVDGPPADWDELRAMAEAIVDAGARHGLNLEPGTNGSWQSFMPFFWQQGGEILDENTDTFGLDSPACTAALGYYQDMFDSGLSPAVESDVPIEAHFAEGDVGAFISGPWMIGIVTDAGADRDTWTVAPLPVEQAGTSFVGGGNLAVFADSDNKPTAWAFVEYVSRPEVQVKWYETASGLPAVPAAWEDPVLADDALVSVFGQQLEDAKAPPAIPTWEQLAAEIDGQIELVATGNATPEQACQGMQQAAESIGTGL